jgi:hypothetical protein
MASYADIIKKDRDEGESDEGAEGLGEVLIVRRTAKVARPGRMCEPQLARQVRRRRKSARGGRRKTTTPEESPMAKGKKGRRKGKKSGHRKSPKRVRAAKKAAATRKRHKAERRAAAAKGRRKRRSGHKRSHAKRRKSRKGGHRKSRKGHRHHKSAGSKGGPARGSASARVNVSVHAGQGKGGSRGKSRRKSTHRRKSRKGGRAREEYMMENPLGAAEMVAGALVMGVGLLAADTLDRVLATYGHTVTVSADGSTVTDQPPAVPAGGTQGRAQMPSGAAVEAPMGLGRWGAGLALVAVPLIAAGFVKHPMARSMLQLFGLGAGARVVGKGAKDMIAKLMAKTALGNRLYINEIQAQNALASFTGGTGPSAGMTVPSTGLAGPQATKRLGVGGCCSSCAAGGPCTKASGSAPSPTVAPPQMSGSAPQMAPPQVTPSAPATQVAPPRTAPQVAPAPHKTTALAGPPSQPRRNPYNWSNNN